MSHILSNLCPQKRIQPCNCDDLVIQKWMEMYDIFGSSVNKICTLISFLTTFSYVLHYGPLEGSKDPQDPQAKVGELPGWTWTCMLIHMYTIQVLQYMHGLPDDTWQEPDQEDPLSLVDKVTHKVSIQQDKVTRNLKYCIQKHSCWLR